MQKLKKLVNKSKVKLITQLTSRKIYLTLSIILQVLASTVNILQSFGGIALHILLTDDIFLFLYSSYFADIEGKLFEPETDLVFIYLGTTTSTIHEELKSGSERRIR